MNSTILLKELPFCRRQQRESHMLFARNRLFVHMKHSVNFRHEFMIMSSKRHGVFPLQSCGAKRYVLDSRQKRKIDPSNKA